jgi:hypothetical protein
MERLAKLYTSAKVRRSIDSVMNAQVLHMRIPITPFGRLCLVRQMSCTGLHIFCYPVSVLRLCSGRGAEHVVTACDIFACVPNLGSSHCEFDFRFARSHSSHVPLMLCRCLAHNVMPFSPLTNLKSSFTALPEILVARNYFFHSKLHVKIP